MLVVLAGVYACETASDFFQKCLLIMPSPAFRFASSTLSQWERAGVRVLLKEVYHMLHWMYFLT
jgi:UDP-N-acetylmuramoylalanine-D-glutamate ligase